MQPRNALELLARTDEIAEIDALFAVPAVAVALLILGVPGIGKTALWQAALARAEGRLALIARPAEAEAALAFSGIADLFAQVPGALIDALPTPQRRALRAALLHGDAKAEPRAVGAAVLAVLRALAAEQPVVVAIDDLQWLDGPSARALVLALRRTGPAPVQVLATARTDWTGRAPPSPFDALPAHRVTPRPLSVAEVRELVHLSLGVDPQQHRLRALHAASGGNPYLALELAQAEWTASALPEPVLRLVESDLATLPVSARTTLLNAALAEPPEAELVIAAGPDPAAAARHLDLAEAAGLLEVRRGEIAFAHPILRLAAIATAEPAARRAAHRRLAAAVTDPDARVRHLGRAAQRPDEDLAAAHEAASRRAAADGAVEIAADLAETAGALTPRPDADASRRRLFAAAEYRYESGDTVRARQILDDLIAVPGRWPGRAQAWERLAKYQRYSGDPLDVWQATLRTALAEAAETDVELRLAVLVDLGMAACNSGDDGETARVSAMLNALAEQHPDRVTDRQAAAALYLNFLNGDGVDDALVRRALSVPDPVVRLPVEVRPSYTVAAVLANAGRLDEARQILAADWDDAVRQGDDIALPITGWLLTRVETWSGNWSHAAAIAAQSIHAAEQADSAAGVALAGGACACLLARQGDVAGTRAAVARTLDLGARLGLALPVALAVEASGMLELSLGDADGAHRAFDRVPEPSLMSGRLEPGMARVLPDQVEALVRIGELDAAGRLLAPFAEQADGLGRNWARAVARRCGGLLRAAKGDLAGAVEALDGAREISERLGMPFEHARILLVSSEVHRRARHKRLAREHATAARSGFDRLGARIWSERCADELLRSGGRAATPSGIGELTVTEQRVAALAADGLTTREIAATLFAGTRTVESHLQQVYRKLGVHSRVELSRRLGMMPQPERNHADSTDSSAPTNS